jgi:amino acid adenylation domain-containing protein
MRLHQLVIAAASRTPDALAVVGAAGRLRYGELDQQANALAHQLSGAGVGPGDRVLIWTEKSPRAIVAMQAVLRLGAVYVPASGTTPAARVAVMARDCTARAVCTSSGMLARIRAELGPDAQLVDLDEPFVPDGDEVPPVDRDVAPDDLAYILYTSGSTGTPKGVSISHRNARAFVDWAVEEIAARPDDRFANHAPFTFDLSVLDLYAAFAVGAAVHLIPAEFAYAPSRLVEFLRREQISVWYSVPSALILMMRDGGLLDQPAPAALRVLLFAGEPFPIPYVRQLAGWTGARLLNLYGPTETNVCTFHEVGPADLARDRPVPIGGPASGDKVWAVKPDGGAAAPGEEGMLMVDGPTVMRGYWGRAPQRGAYATGDVVRVLGDGSFDYLGRNDHMVKVRGHRVELGEVESVLAGHPDVAEAAAVTTGAGIETRLVAFVVRRPGSKPGPLALKRHSAERLPPYMIPDEVRFVGKLPRTPNGKVDRAALADDIVQPVPKEKVP